MARRQGPRTPQRDAPWGRDRTSSGPAFQGQGPKGKQERQQIPTNCGSRDHPAPLPRAQCEAPPGASRAKSHTSNPGHMAVRKAGTRPCVWQRAALKHECVTFTDVKSHLCKSLEAHAQEPGQAHRSSQACPGRGDRRWLAGPGAAQGHAAGKKSGGKCAPALCLSPR